MEQKDPQDKEPNKQIQSLCPSNWSDYLHVDDDIDNENTDKTEPPTDQLTTSQDTRADAKTVVRLPQALGIQKQGTSKNNTTEPMLIVVFDNTDQIWNQKPSPSKTRPPYSTWTLIGPQTLKQDDAEQN